MNNDYLFVYGTLRKAAAKPMHRVLAQHGDYLAEGSMQGRLYDLTAYPGAVLSDNPAERVHGEIYRLTNPEQALPALDHYEGCSPDFAQPQEYIRTRLAIQLSDGDTVSAWVYVFNHAIDQLEHIASGDWLVFTAGRKPVYNKRIDLE